MTNSNTNVPTLASLLTGSYPVGELTALALRLYAVSCEVSAERERDGRTREAELMIAGHKFFRESFDLALAKCLAAGFVPPWSLLN